MHNSLLHLLLKNGDFLNTDISQGSVATHLGCGGVFVYDFVTNLLLSLTVKEFWKLVNIWWSCGQELGILFFLTHSVVCEYCRQTVLFVCMLIIWYKFTYSMCLVTHRPVIHSTLYVYNVCWHLITVVVSIYRLYYVIIRQSIAISDAQCCIALCVCGSVWDLQHYFVFVVVYVISM